MAITCSFLMPAYNAERFILIAIQSVLGQTFRDWELTVVDDCSRDKTREIILAAAENGSKIHPIFNDVNSGAAESRNKGIWLAQGKWIAFLNSDDIFLSDKLRRQVEKTQNEQAPFICCSYDLIDKEGESLGITPRVPSTISQKYIITKTLLGAPQCFFQRDLP